MTLRVKRAARRDLGNVTAGDPLHTVKMNKRRFTTDSRPGCYFKRAQIRHAMADVYW